VSSMTPRMWTMDMHVPFNDSQAWMSPLVKQVSRLTTYASTSENQTAGSFRYYQLLLESIHGLEDLSVIGYHEPGIRSPYVDLRIILQKSLATPRFGNLITLELKLVDLGTSSEILFSNIQFSGLVRLSLIGCNNIATFTNALLKYQDNNKLVMDELSISLPWKSSEPVVDVQAIERFLTNGPKVDELEIDVSHHALLSKSCLIAQAKSL
jgi:hypothetical protein